MLTVAGARSRGYPPPTSTNGVLGSTSELSDFSCILFCFFVLVFCFYIYEIMLSVDSLRKKSTQITKKSANHKDLCAEKRMQGKGFNMIKKKKGKGFNMPNHKGCM